MKKINHFVTDGILQLHDIDTDHPLLLQLTLEVEPGRWEILVDNTQKPRVIVLKAMFQSPSPENGEGSFFQGGKL